MITLAPLLDALLGAGPIARTVESLRSADVADVAVAPGARAALVAALQAASGPSGMPRSLLVGTATSREAEDLVAALSAMIPAESVGLFPSWETLPHERLSPRSDTVGTRLAVLRRLAHPDPDDTTYGPLRVVVAPIRAVLQPIAKGLGDLKPVALRAGDTAPLEQVVEALAAAAYHRTDLVEKRGEFAVRGGILDVFPPTEDHPVRVEFWGDEVEEIRWFKVADQRSLEVAEHGLWAPPCRELLLTDQVRERADALANQLPGARDMLHKIAAGIAVEGMESLAPALLEGMETILDVLPRDAAVTLVDPERVRTRAHDLVATSQEFLEAGWANAASGNAVPIDLQEVLGSSSYWSMAQLREHAAMIGLPWWDLSPFDVDVETGADAVRSGTESAPTYRGDTEAAVADLAQWLRDDWKVAVVTDGPGSAKRIAEVLAGAGLATRLESPLGTLGHRRRARHQRPPGTRFPRARRSAGGRHRGRPHGHCVGHRWLDQGHAADALQAPQPGRPAPASPR
jgi:transcription-repair coupling factor (superfamily II helicase)